MTLGIRTYERSWINPQERSYKALSFYLKEKPRSEILLVEDLDYEKSFNYHVCYGEDLTNEELGVLIDAVLSFVQPGWYLLTCGEHNSEKERLYKKFLISGKVEETCCFRSLIDRSGEKKYYEILKKK